MERKELSERIVERLHPKLFPIDVSPADGSVNIFKTRTNILGARYALAMVTLGEGELSEQIEKFRGIVRRQTKAAWIFREVGLELVFIGDEKNWFNEKVKVRPDRTGAHAVIIQKIHFIDPESGATYTQSASWGPLVFGNTRIQRVLESLSS